MNMMKTLTIICLSLMLFSCNTGTSENNSKITATDSTTSILTDSTKATKNQNQQAPGAVKQDEKQQLLNSSRNPVNSITAPKQLDKKSIEAINLYRSGSQLAQKGEHQQAIAELTRSLEKERITVTLVKRGFSYVILKNYNDALTDFNEALQMDPNITAAYFARGLCYFEMQKIDKAGQDMSAFIKKDSTNSLAYNYMAGINFLQKNYQGALNNYDKVVKLDPKFPNIYTNRGMMRHYLGNFSGAIDDYNEAIKANPSSSSAFNNRGAAKLNQNDLSSALKDFDQAILLKADYADAYDNRGKVKLKLGDKVGACSDWQRAYSLGLASSGAMITKYCKQE